MAIAPEQWNRLLHLKPVDFKYPDRLDYSIVFALDRFTALIGSKPVIMSDFRPGDPRQHGIGRAIDTTWPGVDPVFINQKALESQLFSGVGLYWNDVQVASHHFDTRTNRTITAPARWGAYISHPYDQATGHNVAKYEYTTMDSILDMIKKKGVIAGSFLIVFGLFLYLALKPKGA